MIRLVVFQQNDEICALWLFRGNRLPPNAEVVFKFDGEHLDADEIKKQAVGCCRSQGITKVENLYTD